MIKFDSEVDRGEVGVDSELDGLMCKIIGYTMHES